MKYILILFSFILSIELEAQIEGWSRSYEMYPAYEIAHRLAVYNDTIIMNTRSSCYNNDECSFLSRIDSFGNLIETKEFHKVGKPIQLGSFSSILNIDNCYYITGDDAWDNDTSSFQTEHLYKISNELSKVERTKLPAALNLSQYAVNFVYYEKDSLFVTYSLKELSKEHYTYAMNVTAISLKGSVLWQYDYTNFKYKLFHVGDVIQNSDTSFICSMRVGIWRIQYFSMNIKGELLWEYTEDEGLIDGLFDLSSFNPFIADVNGKDLIRVWYFDSPNYQHLSPEISRLDYQGNKKWTVQLRDDYGGPGFFPWTKSTVIVGNKIQQLVKAKNGDILGVGYCLLSENYWTTGDPYYNLGYAFRIDTSGKILWERFYLDLDKDKYGDQYLFNIAEADYGAIYLSGTLRDSLPKGTPGTGNNNIWLIKVGPDGCITPGCTDTLLQVSTTKILNQHPYLLTVYPNPGTDQVTVGWNDVLSLPKKVEIRSMTGQLVRTEIIESNSGTAQLDVSFLQSGMYLITLRGRDWQSMPVKWVKM